MQAHNNTYSFCVLQNNLITDIYITPPSFLIDRQTLNEMGGKKNCGNNPDSRIDGNQKKYLNTKISKMFQRIFLNKGVFNIEITQTHSILSDDFGARSEITLTTTMLKRRR